DLAFILGNHMPDEASFASDIPEGEGPVIGAAPSQVLADNLSAEGIDLAGLMASLLDRMIEETGGRAVLIAHSWLGPEKRSRNNDYHICAAVLERMRNRDRAVFIDRELSAAGLREVISHLDTFVACRFHAMISSLCVRVPCVVPAWSHKYREVMDEFGLGRYVIDMSRLSVDSLTEAVRETLSGSEEIRRMIETSLPAVRESSRSQLEYTADFLDKAEISVRTGGISARLYQDIYRKRLRRAWMGYSAQADIREGAASGGLVSTLLIDLLERGEIDGVIAARTSPGSGGLEFETVLCRTTAEILDCGTSIYSDFSHAAGIIDILKKTTGRFAAVALPCQWTTIGKWLESKRPRAGELILRVGLWCGHATHRRLVNDFLDGRSVEKSSIDRFWYRKGIWRGATEILMKDGSTIRIPFNHGYGLLQNLYVDCMGRCLSCEDHFADDSDISFGDAWLPEIKKRRKKHSMAVSLTDRGDEAGDILVSSGRALISEV
ncbi:MAG: Coenzyme F420 hydrogenase/dehydrogenase, beta subunit C-terminal domain, partial [Candidatus Krumholzibacteria bacterium]|nr:Coenzyme F420 hydrogenase/dehydrogenase, beta subunit C-terminal domain [Candidatus Krumholzibacteria bacterium]